MAMCQLLSDLFLYQIFLYFSKFKRTGDAEFESWQQIFEACKKGQHSISAHFLKVSHHGSHNGTSNIIAKKNLST